METLINKKLSKKPGPADFYEPNFILVLLNKYLRWTVLLLIAGVIIFSYILILSYKIDEVSNSATESIPAKEKVLSDLKAIKSDLDQIVVDFDSIKASKSDILDELDRLLPKEPQFAEMFKLFDEITSRSGMKLNSISMSEHAGVDNTTEKFQEDGFDFSQLEKKVSSMTVSISVAGGNYDTFKNYLDTLERNLRIFDLQSISVDGGVYRAQDILLSDISDEERDSRTIEGSYSLELITYFHNSD